MRQIKVFTTFHSNLVDKHMSHSHTVHALHSGCCTFWYHNRFLTIHHRICIDSFHTCRVVHNLDCTMLKEKVENTLEFSIFLLMLQKSPVHEPWQLQCPDERSKVPCSEQSGRHLNILSFLSSQISPVHPTSQKHFPFEQVPWLEHSLSKQSPGNNKGITIL